MGTCFQITLKCFVATTLIASLFYLGCLSWWIVDIVKNHPRNEYNSTGIGPEVFAVNLSCAGIGVFAVLCQAIGSLSLLFYCGDYQKSHAKKWAVAQVFLLVIVILVYFLPFAFSGSGAHNSLSEFWDKAAAHTKAAANVSHLHAEYTLPWGFYIHSAFDIIAVFVVILLWKCAKKQGYTAVR
ncbi:hypothetical protein Ocin01_07354 [Orchesella cincta]|uniref:Transmembrane protein n=1 Tax=Orchesella cincta TaxID=48709 RepID=A0A1D2N225_ORCCI|nr:hypothetical protein Ocin01_07354 [Orchesella cincta]